jgi:hypothetical protein
VVCLRSSYEFTEEDVIIVEELSLSFGKMFDTIMLAEDPPIEIELSLSSRNQRELNLKTSSIVRRRPTKLKAIPHFTRSMTDIYAESDLFTPGKTPTQIFETMLMVNMTVSETPEELDLMAIPAVDALSGIRDIISGPFADQVLETFDQIATN